MKKNRLKIGFRQTIAFLALNDRSIGESMQANLEPTYFREIIQETVPEAFRGGFEWGEAGMYVFGGILFFMNRDEQMHGSRSHQCDDLSFSVGYPLFSNKQLACIGIIFSAATGATLCGSRAALRVTVKHLKKKLHIP